MERSKPVLGAAAAPRFSVRVEWVFPGLSLPQQMRKVAAAGYEGYEFGDWTAVDPREIVLLARKLKIECACTGGNRPLNRKGTGLTDPRERGGFLNSIRESVEAAKRLECRRLVLVSGIEAPGLTRAEQHASIVEGLKAAHDLVAAHGIQLVLEPLNTLVDHPGQYLNTAREAFAIIREVGSPHIKVLFDIYHVQIMEGNLIAAIRSNIGAIGHFHVADVPGRHEPGTGEIDWPNVFTAIRESGYRDYIGVEYVPLVDPLSTLPRIREMATHIQTGRH